MTSTTEPRIVIDLPDFWTSRPWSTGDSEALRRAVTLTIDDVSPTIEPIFTASSAVPIEDESGGVANILFSFLSIFIVTNVDGQSIRSRRHGQVRSIAFSESESFEMFEAVFVGPESPRGEVPLLIFSSPNLDLSETLQDVFASISETLRWESES